MPQSVKIIFLTQVELLNMEDQDQTEALAPAGKKQGLAGGQGGPVPTTSSAGGAQATPSAIGIMGQMTPSTSNAPGGRDPSEIPLPRGA